MSLLSSPIAYPPSSSPAPLPRKRKSEDSIGSSGRVKRKLLGLNAADLIPDGVDDRRNIQISATESNAKYTLKYNSSPLSTSLIQETDNCGKASDRVLNTTLHDVSECPPLLHESIACQLAGDQNTFQKACHKSPFQVQTSSGKTISTGKKKAWQAVSYEKLIASRSTTAHGKATRSFYGVDIHGLLDQAVGESKEVLKASDPIDKENLQPKAEGPSLSKINKRGRSMMWTEKYRAKRFTDLIGDERTHRHVLRWLKLWDPIVFPGNSKAESRINNRFNPDVEDSSAHRKILLLAGPPGLGKTTLAHVCARQVGYEVVEINASDERNREVVRGKIKDLVGTENVKGININDASGVTRKPGRPVCVVIDEVDGVVGGSGAGGDGGFIKALIELVTVDKKNSNLGRNSGNTAKSGKARKGDRFRFLRPVILICNDVYHPSLRPLRSSGAAEIIHVRSPPLEKVVGRLKTVFEREGVPCDGDGVRRLCEAVWGIDSKKDPRMRSGNIVQGDLRSILVVAEWASTKMRAERVLHAVNSNRLTKRWVENSLMKTLSSSSAGVKGIGRGGVHEAVERVFLDEANFSRCSAETSAGVLSKSQKGGSFGVSEIRRRNAMEELRHIIDTSGENDRIMTDCFTNYPSCSFQDDTLLSKPNAAYEWLHFHDRVSSKVFSGQEWELTQYLSQAALGFHYLFASSRKQRSSNNRGNLWHDNDEEQSLPFSTRRADFEASETQKQNKTTLHALQSSLSVPLLQAFRSPEEISVELLPQLSKILLPDIKPVIIGRSKDQEGIVSVKKAAEREMLLRAVSAMSAVGVIFERVRNEDADGIGGSNYAYRMEP